MIPILHYKDAPPESFMIRSFEKSGVTDVVRDIISDVERRGDEALFEYASRFDGADLTALEVSREEIDAAYARVDVNFISVLKRAAENIRDFHSHQIENGYRIERADGTCMGVKITPVEKVGLCIPGHTAAYPSTVLMTAIPAKIAGVGEIVMCTPPQKDGTASTRAAAAEQAAAPAHLIEHGGQ